jgi:hypothetical protein
MGKNKCKDCTNKLICGNKQSVDCKHYDIALTRSEIINMLNEEKTKNPALIPAILGAVHKVYRINLAY